MNPSRPKLPSTTLLAAALVITTVAAGGYYYTWNRAREQAWMEGTHEASFKVVRDRFYGYLADGKYDLAYAMTGGRFQEEVASIQFAELAKRYDALNNQSPDKYAGDSAGQSGGSGRGGHPHHLEQQQIEFHRQFKYADGKLVTITLRVGREPDSLLVMTPPALCVTSFAIVEKQGQGN